MPVSWHVPGHRELLSGGMRDPHPLAVGPEPEHGPEYQSEEVREVIPKRRAPAEGAGYEPDAAIPDHQPDPVQHEEHYAFVRGALARPVPERPVTVANQTYNDGH